MLLHNETSETIRGLCFYIPGTDIEYKCKKLKPKMSNQEHIYDGYAGDLIFYFKENPAKTFLFPHLINGKNRGNSEDYFLEFYIYKKDGCYCIEHKKAVKQLDRTILQ